MRTRTDLTGQTFGRLEVLHYAYNKNNRVFWHCKCDCLNEKAISSSSLKRGDTLSCGCLCKEIVSRDLTGLRFGHLVAIEKVGSNATHHLLWKCKCDCGGEKIVQGQSLVTGNVKTCGCRTR